jgi:hypothetical protein
MDGCTTGLERYVVLIDMPAPRYLAVSVAHADKY